MYNCVAVVPVSNLRLPCRLKLLCKIQYTSKVLENPNSTTRELEVHGASD